MSLQNGKNKRSARVLFICSQPFFEWRGSPIRVGFDLMALVKAGYRVNFLSLPHGNARTIEGVETTRCMQLPGVKSLPIGPSAPKLIYDLIHFFYGLYFLMRFPTIRVIHCVEDSGLPGLLLAKIFQKKLVFEKHSDPSSHEQKGAPLRHFILKAYEFVESLVIRHADAVIGTGDELIKQAASVDQTINAYSIPDIPSSLVEADSQKVAEIRSKIAGEDSVVATYVGSFAVYQGIDLLFASIPEALKACPELKILIIGGSQEQIKARRQKLEAQALADRVVFAGFINPDELPAYLSASDILFSPRIAGRNSPLKVLDYLKAERAILATDIEANRQILSETTAVLVRPKAQDFAKALVEITRDKQRRFDLGRSGAELLGTRYNYAYFSSQIANCYRSVDSCDGLQI